MKAHYFKDSYIMDSNYSQYAWDKFLAEPPSKIAVDTETPSLKDRSLLGVGVAVSKDESFYIEEDDDDFERFMLVLADPRITKVFHNAPYDLRVLRSKGIDHSNVDDTAIMARLANCAGSLEEVAANVGRAVPSAKSTMITYGVATMDKLPFDVLARKCCTDAEATYEVSEWLEGRYDDTYYQVERQLLSVLEQISRRGILIDQERRQELETFYMKERNYYRQVALGMGFNPSKNFEVGYMLAEAGAILPLTDGKTMLKTDEETLSRVRAPKAVPIARLVLLFRRANKQLSTYIMPIKGQERAYTMLHLDAITGRISGTSAGKNNVDRNLVNITKRADRHMPPELRIRSMFVPDEDVMSLADDSQAEMRILAYLSGDKRMRQVYESGEDIHSDTERAIWGTDGYNRVWTKNFNYGLLYGGDALTIAGVINQPVDVVARYMQTWFETYPEAAAWRQEQIYTGMRDGYITTLYGRRIPIPVEMGDKHAANCAVNYPIQATAAEIFKRSILALSTEQLKKMLLPVHDERMFNGRPVMNLDELANVSPVHIPVEVDIVDRWG